MNETSRRWKPEAERDPRNRIGITLDTGEDSRTFCRQYMNTKLVPTVKRGRGRPATVVAVRDLRVMLTAEQDARFVAYRAHIEAQAPGFLPSDSALARAIFSLGLEAFEAQKAQLPLPLESSTKKT